MPAGRPTDYRPAYVDQARKLALLGATDLELADFFGVSVRSIYEWKAKHEDFSQALKLGKEEADQRVVRSLFQRAVGYVAPEDRVFIQDGETVVVPMLKHHPPDTTAAIFWLKNRQPKEWRDRQEVAHDMADRLADVLEHVGKRGGLIGHPQGEGGEE